MKLLLSALLVVLGLSQAVEAKTKVPATEAKAAEKTRPQFDNSSTGGIAKQPNAKAPAKADGYNSLYPPAMNFSFQ